MVLLLGLLLPFGARARDVTDSDMFDVWGAVRSVVASDDRILDVEAFWSCHEAENYSGANLMNRWYGTSLADVYQDLSLTMPPANPGGMAIGLGSD